MGAPGGPHGGLQWGPLCGALWEAFAGAPLGARPLWGRPGGGPSGYQWIFSLTKLQPARLGEQSSSSKRAKTPGAASAPEAPPMKRKYIKKTSKCPKCNVDGCEDHENTWAWGFKLFDDAKTFSDFCEKLKSDKALSTEYEAAHKVRMRLPKDEQAVKKINQSEVVEAEHVYLRVMDTFIGPSVSQLRAMAKTPAGKDADDSAPPGRLKSSKLINMPTSTAGYKKGMFLKQQEFTQYQLVRDFSLSKLDLRIPR